MNDVYNNITHELKSDDLFIYSAYGNSLESHRVRVKRQKSKE